MLKSDIPKTKSSENISTHTTYPPNTRRVDNLDGFEPSITDQAAANEMDINQILAKYEKTGQLPDLIKTNPRYGDFSESVDFQESLNIIHVAQEQFAALPAFVRRRFDNDPSKFLDFVHDPKNDKELVAMGLATQKEEISLKSDPADPKAIPLSSSQGKPAVGEGPKT